MELKKHLPFIILCIILAIYLGLKTLPEDGWTGWGVFSAQTLLSSEHWARDGFIHSKFLFIPIGYSKIVQYLDDPEMRHHARGTVTGELIGRRLYYTHYPSGYLFPYALLMKFGATQRYWFRLLALFFSFSALILFYLFFNLITKNSLISFFTISYYAISTMFLDYADSLANQPIDDLLRAAILVLSVLAATRRHSERSEESPANAGLAFARDSSSRFSIGTQNDKVLIFFTWFLYLLLSISSYDSTFFIFIWLVGLDIVIQKKLLWKKWLFFVSAPILAFGLQILQNWWYLGWKDMWLDLKGSFLFRSSDGPGGIFLEKHIRSMFSPLAYMTDLRVRFALPIILIIISCFAYLKKKISTSWIDFRYLLILFLAGSTYAFVFVSSGYFPYQGRQWMLWFGLLIGWATVLLLSWRPALPNLLRRNAELPKVSLAAFLILFISVATIWGIQINRTIDYVKDWPNHKADTKMIEFYKSLKSQIADGGIFYIDNNFKTDYPQPDPAEEYYAGRTILNFRNFQDFTKDYTWLKNRSEYAYNSIIISPQKELVEGIKQVLLLPGEIKFMNNKYVLY